MNNSDDNPYSPPFTTKPELVPPEGPREPAQTRPFFRVAAAMLGLVAIGAGLGSFSTVTFPNSIFGVSMILFGAQFLFAAVTGRWFTFGGKTLG